MPSALEIRALAPKTHARYTLLMDQFTNFCAQRSLPRSTPVEIDVALIELFGHLAGPSHDKLSRKRTIADLNQKSGNLLKQISKIKPEVVASIRRQAVTLGDRLAKLL